MGAVGVATRACSTRAFTPDDRRPGRHEESLERFQTKAMAWSATAGTPELASMTASTLGRARISGTLHRVGTKPDDTMCSGSDCKEWQSLTPITTHYWYITAQRAFLKVHGCRILSPNKSEDPNNPSGRTSVPLTPHTPPRLPHVSTSIHRGPSPSIPTTPKCMRAHR